MESKKKYREGAKLFLDALLEKQMLSFPSVVGRTKYMKFYSRHIFSSDTIDRYYFLKVRTIYNRVLIIRNSSLRLIIIEAI